MRVDCDGELHPQAIEGMRLFNAGKFFEAHEELEFAWRDEKESIRSLYQGILQVAVCYLHITRGNFNGAVKVYDRSMNWLKNFPGVCRGVHVGKLRRDAGIIMNKLEMLGTERINEFDLALFCPIVWNEKREWVCDRCGARMRDRNCKVTCLNCGNRFDCSDLNIYFD